MATPLIAGIAVAVTALAGKYGIEAWQAFKTRQAVPTVRKYYEGGFQAVMTRREAARILGVRESVAQDKVKEAHRRVMQANHPDAGGSDYLASKINEAKDHLLGQSRGSGSAFWTLHGVKHTYQFCINWNFNGIQLWEFNGLFISVALDSADLLVLAQSFKAQTAGGCMQYYELVLCLIQGFNS